MAYTYSRTQEKLMEQINEVIFYDRWYMYKCSGTTVDDVRLRQLWKCYGMDKRYKPYFLNSAMNSSKDKILQVCVGKYEFIVVIQSDLKSVHVCSRDTWDDSEKVKWWI